VQPSIFSGDMPRLSLFCRKMMLSQMINQPKSKKVPQTPETLSRTLALMRGSTTYKIKIFGRTDPAIYSSEHFQTNKTECRQLAIILGVIEVLFGSLFLIAHRAGRILELQAINKRNAQQQLAQTEKMSSSGQLMTKVSRQLNTPIAFSHSNLYLAIKALKDIDLPLKIVSHHTLLVKKIPTNQNFVITLPQTTPLTVLEY
jgi:hypothetical protein